MSPPGRAVAAGVNPDRPPPPPRPILADAHFVGGGRRGHREDPSAHDVLGICKGLPWRPACPFPAPPGPCFCPHALAHRARPGCCPSAAPVLLCLCACCSPALRPPHQPALCVAGTLAPSEGGGSKGPQKGLCTGRWAACSTPCAQCCGLHGTPPACMESPTPSPTARHIRCTPSPPFHCGGKAESDIRKLLSDRWSDCGMFE